MITAAETELGDDWTFVDPENEEDVKKSASKFESTLNKRFVSSFRRGVDPLVPSVPITDFSKRMQEALTVDAGTSELKTKCNGTVLNTSTVKTLLQQPAILAAIEHGSSEDTDKPFSAAAFVAVDGRLMRFVSVFQFTDADRPEDVIPPLRAFAPSMLLTKDQLGGGISYHEMPVKPRGLSKDACCQTFIAILGTNGL